MHQCLLYNMLPITFLKIKSINIRTLFLCLLMGIFFLPSVLKAQDVKIKNNTEALSGLCMGSDFTINFTADGKFDAGNEFMLEISDEQGGWGNSQILYPSLPQSGNLVSTSLSITVTLPKGLTPGSKYQVRVISTAPQAVSNGSSMKFLTVVVEKKDSTSCTKNDGYINISTKSGSSPIKYFISGKEYNPPYLDKLGPGNYPVKVVDNSGCEFLDTVIIKRISTIKFIGQPSISPSLCDTPIRTIQLLVTGANKLYAGIKKIGVPGDPTYQEGVSPFNFEVSGIGNYIIYVKDQTGCVDSIRVDVVLESKLYIDGFTLENVKCAGASDGAIKDIFFSGNGNLFLSINGEKVQETFENGGVYNFENLKKGIYTIKLWNEEGCSVSQDVEIREPDELKFDIMLADPTCGKSDGKISVKASGGTPDYRYRIGSITNIDGEFTNLSAGIYEIDVEDSNSCITSQTVTLLQNAAIEITDTIIRKSCPEESDGSIQIKVKGNSNIEYELDGIKNNTGIFDNLAAGLKNIKLTIDGCSKEITIQLDNVPKAIFDRSIFNPLCADNKATGKIEFTITDGEQPFLFSINGGDFIEKNIFDNLEPGTYGIIAKYGPGCLDFFEIKIDEVPDIILNITSTIQNCNIIDLKVDASGGAGFFQYKLDNGSFGPANTFNNVSPGNHSITVKDFNNCEKNQTFVIDQPKNIELEAIAKATACINRQNGEISVKAAGNGKLKLFIDGSFILERKSPLEFTQPNLSAKDYEISVIDENGCSIQKTITIKVDDTLEVSVKKSDLTCKLTNGKATFEVTKGNSIYEFSLDGSSFQPGNTFPGLSEGTHTYVVRDVSGKGCEVTGEFFLSSSIGIEILDAEVRNPCFQTNNGEIEVIVNSNGSFTYTINNGSPQSSNIFRNLSEGVYQIRVTDGSCSDDTTITLTMTPQISDIKLITKDVTCINSNNGSVEIQVTGGAGTISYSLDSVFFQKNNFFQGLKPGNYKAYVKDENGCTESTEFELKVLNDFKLAVEIISQNCNTVKVKATAIGSSFDVIFSFNGKAFGTQDTYEMIGSGDLKIEAKDTRYQCLKDTTIKIESAAQLTMKVTGFNLKCNGDNSGQISVTAVGNGKIELYVNDVLKKTENNQLNGSIFNLLSDNYKISVIDEKGCRKDTIITLIEPEKLEFKVESTPANCTTPDGIIKISDLKGGSNQFVVFLDNIESQELEFKNLKSGVYKIKVSDKKQLDCFIEKDVTVDNTSSFSSKIKKITPTCRNNKTGIIEIETVSGTAPFEFTLSGSKTETNQTGIFANLAPGIYDVVVKDSKGCEYTISKIQIELVPDISIKSEIKNISCFGKKDGSISITATGGYGVLQFSIDGTNFQADGQFVNLQAGVFSIFIKDDLGCLTEKKGFTISEPSELKVGKITSKHLSCFESNDGSILVEVSGGTPSENGEYILVNNDGTNLKAKSPIILESLMAKTYKLSVKDENGCEIIIDDIVITQPTAISYAVKIFQPNCEGEKNGSITIETPAGGTPPYIYSMDGVNYSSVNIFSNLGNGTYQTFAKDSKECVNTKSAKIEAPKVIISPINKICINDETTPFSIDLKKYGNPSGGKWSSPGLTIKNDQLILDTTASSGKFKISYKYQDCETFAEIEIINLKSPSEAQICEDQKAFKLPTVIPIGGTWSTTDKSFTINGSDLTWKTDLKGEFSFEYALNGCKKSFNLIISPLPEVEFETLPNADYIAGESISFVNKSTIQGDSKPMSYKWTIDGNEFSTENTDFIFNNPGKYTVKLEAKSKFGCTHFIEKQIDIIDALKLETENIFTPNGDGVNDLFPKREFFKDGYEFKFKIFDKWGALIFNSENNQSWDGKKNNGVVDLGVYFWSLEIKNLNKPEKPIIKKVGSVTLLK